jgi:hypothetical protein
VDVQSCTTKGMVESLYLEDTTYELVISKPSTVKSWAM